MRTPTRRDVEPTLSTYQDTIRAARNRQLRLTATNVRRLARTYQDAAEGIMARLYGIPGYMIGNRDERMEQVYMQNMLREIEETLRQFNATFTSRLRGGMLELAQSAVVRERRVQELLGPLGTQDPLVRAEMTETFTEPGGGERTITFGHVAHDAVEALATRYYGDGLRLSDRLYGVDQKLRTGVADTMMQSIAEGLSVEQTMNRLLEGPLATTSASAMQAARIARTEIAHAHSEAHLRSTLDPQTGKLRDGVKGVKWQLSASHPKPDICDVWALHDSGLGPGVYSDMNAVPSDHPNGLCFTTTVLAALPETERWGTGQTPDLDGITDAELQRYADAGDVAAQAMLRG